MECTSAAGNPHDWKVDVSGTTGSDRFDLLDTEPCCDYAAHVVPTNRSSTGEILGEGPVFSIPSGNIRAAVGAGYRSEGLVSEAVLSVTASRHIEYGFAEVTLPIPQILRWLSRRMDARIHLDPVLEHDHVLVFPQVIALPALLDAGSDLVGKSDRLVERQ